MATLYLVGTPLGNLGDLSPRAQETLADVDFIAAEDTRVTLRLLNHFGIQKPLVSYYQAQRGRAARAAAILDRIAAGEDCALVTDAGMPAISDPGEELVRLAAERGITVCPVPGASAAITALAASGLPTERFSFEGFLPATRNQRRAALAELADERRTMIFYEAPHRLCDCLRDLRDAFGGERRIAVCRELTKLHEEFLRVSLEEAVQHFDAVEPRGEFVLVIAGAPEKQQEALTPDDAVALARRLQDEGLSPAAAAKEAAKRSGVARAVIYKVLVNGGE